MMLPYTATLLDIINPQAITDYEHAFYRTFSRVTDNQLIRSLWAWDLTAERLAARIEYAHQRVYVGRDVQGVIEMAIAVNTELEAYQSSAFGFPMPNPKQGCCEFLTFFTVGDHSLKHKLHFWEGCFKDLSEAGYHTGYASSAARLLPVYRRIGGKVLAECTVEGERRYHWQFSLTRHWMKARD
jgi:hypothetical protein